MFSMFNLLSGSEKVHKMYDFNSSILKIETNNGKFVSLEYGFSWIYVNRERFFTRSTRLLVDVSDNKSLVYPLFWDRKINLDDIVSKKKGAKNAPIFLVRAYESNYKLIYGYRNFQQHFILTPDEYDDFLQKIQESLIGINDLNMTFVKPSVDKIINRK